METGTKDDFLVWIQQPAIDAAVIALAAAAEANAATNSVLSNIVSLEIRDDLHVWLTTPDNYNGLTFSIQNGKLIATI